MSVAATTAAIVSANTTIALAAKRAACDAMVKGYTHRGATVAQAQEYADCVRTLYPNPLSPETVIAIKVAFLIVAITSLVGGVLGFREGNRFGDAFESALLWGLISASVMGALAIAMVVWGKL